MGLIASEKLGPSDWEKLKTIQLLSLLKLHQICNKYKINYILMFGTLLGAARHNGYIPWDDDIDVAMLRVDFDKFLSVPREEFGENFFLQNYASDPGYPSQLLKIRVNDTLSVQRSCAHVKNMNHGIWIDIFPFDNSPDSKIITKIYKYLLKYSEVLLYFKKGYLKIPSEKKIVAILLKLFCLMPEKRIQKIYFRLMTKYDGRERKYVGPTTSIEDYERDRFPKEYFTDTIMLDFEGFKFKAPRNYHQVLTQMYGDYMQLPPVEKRCKNVDMFSEVSFGKYSNIKSIYDACKIADVMIDNMDVRGESIDSLFFKSVNMK